MLFIWCSHGSSHISICTHCPWSICTHCPCYWPLKRSCLFVPFPHGFIYIRNVTPNLLFTRLNHPSSLSLFSQGSGSSPLMIFVAIYWTLSSMSVSLFYQGVQNWTQNSMCDLTRAEERAKITYFNLLAMLLQMQPRMSLLHGHSFWLLFKKLSAIAPDLFVQIWKEYCLLKCESLIKGILPCFNSFSQKIRQLLCEIMWDVSTSICIIHNPLENITIYWNRHSTTAYWEHTLKTISFSFIYCVRVP